MMGHSTGIEVSILLDSAHSILIPKNQREASSSDENDDLLVIGIDFGTTFSGVAWTTSEEFKKGDINTIVSWPGTGFEEGKAPTELYYDGDTMKWGYSVPAEADPIRWFKLLLLKDEDLGPELCSSEFIIRAKKMLRSLKKNAIDLVADYLGALFKYVIQTINKSRGKEVVDAMRLHVVITVPAIWKGYAREDMITAAKRAGILTTRVAGETTLTLAPEPEAAALSTLSERGRKVNKGDVYIICDAGGGTVDLISYQIEQNSPISMHEAVEGTGSLCGGIFIDEAFEQMCSDRLGLKWNHLSRAGIKKIMKSEWEAAIKPQFAPGLSHKEYIVEIPAEAFRNSELDDSSREPIIRNGKIHFKESHIQDAFTESFTGIDQLLEKQMKMAASSKLRINGIILVGGLGASPYLYEHLSKKHAPAGISILQSRGMQPRTAICRGAVHKGFLDGSRIQEHALIKHDGYRVKAPIRVTSTVSRSSYGVPYSATFDRNRHIQDDKEYDMDLGVWRARNQIDWFLRRGDDVSQKDPAKFSYFEIFREDFGGHFSVDIWACDEMEVPVRRTFHVNDFCKIECKLDIPFSSLPDIKTIDGTMAKKMTYEVEMIPSGASMEFAVYIDEKKQGSHNVRVRFQ
ncbi:hypothetical protein CORC01_14123 [Colletotrichum orchidophilum]|uniref:Hsp70-like protein n=1 Tax=Colletotrichum orchidophilum TaxID=1209926 RepID=A0A1G4ANA2_9PEZI|nr:uncharacterized protein CORC01_14123 [Colletotrichum orchidophilum]OHE90576.1 hypothetical protein CORC01_14123 [Colletotrichum orchidophilum]